MSIVHHPDIATLMAFGAGTLDEAYATVVSTHLAMCPACREQTRRIAAIGGALLETEAGAELSEGLRDRLLGAAADSEPIERPAPHAGDVPLPLSRHVGGDLDAVKWRFKGPGVWTADLPTGDAGRSRLMLLRVAAGREVPEHSHGGQELTLILRGAYRDRFGVFAAGDLADHDEDVEHQPIAEPGEDCVCLVAVDAPLSFRSRLMRVLQPLFGM